MLENLRRRLLKGRATPPEHAHLDHLTSQEEAERELVLVKQLRNVLSTYPPYRRERKVSAVQSIAWTGLLPLELIYLIIDLYCSHDSEMDALRALAGTCKILYSYCRQYIYRTVIVGPRTDTVVGELSIPERFARLVVQVPHILPHIQNLCITMQNCTRKAKFDPFNREEESIAFLLARRMKKLRQFKIAISVDWILLPDRLQSVISATFQSPALNDVCIEGFRSLPLGLLLHIKGLQRLDFRCEAAPPSNQEELSPFNVQPKVLHLHDPRPSTVRYLFGDRSPLTMSQLSSLSVFGNGRVVSTLAGYLPSFSSLTRLELDPGTLGGVPAVPDLRNLPNLRYLTLTVNIVVSLSITLIGESTPRWRWIIETLNTCYKPSAVEEINIVVLTNSPKQTQIYDWTALDSVFTLSDHHSWPALEVVDISICAEFDFTRGYLGNVFFDQYLPDQMVNLVERGVKLRGRYSPKRFHGQLSQQHP